jgi:hypothetical protein
MCPVHLSYIIKTIDMTTLARIEEDFNQNVIGYSAIGIILSTCIGSFAVMQTLAFGNGALQMFIVMITVLLCSTHNAAILTVQKPKMILRLLIASTAINSLIILVSLFI